jgi:DNA-binding NtrC family response regulator
MYSKTLLMIDDNAAMLSVAECALQGTYNAIFASNGRSGIRKFRAHKPDVVLLDLRMPDLHGLEVLSFLKAIDPSVPVIIITAVDDAPTASEAIRLGAFSYLVKPFELRLLLSTIQEATSQAPVADGIILASEITKGIFEEFTRTYATTDTIVVLGERGVGKRALSRAVHRRCHGSEQSFLLADAAALKKERFVRQMEDHLLTLCVHTPLTESMKVLENPDIAKLARKLIVAIEIPEGATESAYPSESTLSERLKTIVVPPLRERKGEAFPVLCYWHQKIAPERPFDTRLAESHIRRLEMAGFPGNLATVANLARQMTRD